MGYLLYISLLAFGSLAMVQAQSCPDPSVVQNCIGELQPSQNSMNFFNGKETPEEKCRIIRESLKCVDEYLDECAHGSEREVIDSKLHQVRTVITKFCNDRELQEELMQNKECYQAVSSDWNRCLRNLDPTTKRDDICSLRDKIIGCGRESAMKHCSQSGVKSVCKLAANMMTIFIPPSSCRTDGTELCSSGFFVQPTFLLLFVAIALGIKNLCRNI